MSGTPNFYDVLIVGGGHGGAAAASGLRQKKFEGSIAIVGDEPEPPYERPPLSKDYLSDEKSFDRILIRPETFWSERGVDLLTGRSAVVVDAGARTVELSDGSTLGYGTLIWSAGARARRLTCEGGDLRGVHIIRTRADVDVLKAELVAVRRVVVVGGGYIGLEAAAVLLKQGKTVTILEMAERLLKRVAGEPLAVFYDEEHRRHGAEIRYLAEVARLEGQDGRVSAVRLADGERLEADIVIVGIGVVPNVEPLIAAGAAGAVGANGVLIDKVCRTSLPGVFAIGDCAAHANRYADGAVIRLESVQNAHDQAAAVAKVICGEAASYDAVPWFWSNQYDLKLQTMGLSIGHDEALVRGDPATRSFSIVYRKAGRVIALDCVNATRDYVQGKALVAVGWRGDADRLTDVETPLKALLAATDSLA